MITDKQTPVEWLVDTLNINRMISQDSGQIANNVLPDIIRHAKQMEKDSKVRKCYHPLPYRLSKSDSNFECTLCGQFV